MKSMMLAALLSATKVVSILESLISVKMPKKLFAKKLSKYRMAVPMESLYAFQTPEGEHSTELFHTFS